MQSILEALPRDASTAASLISSSAALLASVERSAVDVPHWASGLFFDGPRCLAVAVRRGGRRILPGVAVATPSDAAAVVHRYDPRTTQIGRLAGSLAALGGAAPALRPLLRRTTTVVVAGRGGAWEEEGGRAALEELLGENAGGRNRNGPRLRAREGWLMSWVVRFAWAGSALEDLRALLECVPALTSIEIPPQYVSGLGQREVWKELKQLRKCAFVRSLGSDVPPGCSLGDVIESVPWIEDLTIQMSLPLMNRRIAEALSNSTHLTALDLSTNEMTALDAVPLARSVGRMVKLKRLILERNSLCRGVTAIARALTQLPSLAVVDLSMNTFDGDADLATSVGKFGALESIAVRGNPWDHNALVLFVQALAHTPVQSIDIAKTQLSAHGVSTLVQVIPKLKRLSALDVSGNAACVSQWKDLVEALSTQTSSIVELRAADCGLTFVELLLLTESPFWERLHVLDLSSNKLASKGAEVLFTHLPRASSMKLLDVHWNNLGKEGEPRIREASRHIIDLRL